MSVFWKAPAKSYQTPESKKRVLPSVSPHKGLAVCHSPMGGLQGSEETSWPEYSAFAAPFHFQCCSSSVWKPVAVAAIKCVLLIAIPCKMVQYVCKIEKYTTQITRSLLKLWAETSNAGLSFDYIKFYLRGYISDVKPNINLMFVFIRKY